MRCKTPLQAERTRRVLDAALELLFSRGRKAVTVTNVARIGLVTRDWIYRNIGNSSKILEALLDREVPKIVGLIQKCPDIHRANHMARVLAMRMPLIDLANRTGRLWGKTPLLAHLRSALPTSSQWLALSALAVCLDGHARNASTNEISTAINAVLNYRII